MPECRYCTFLHSIMDEQPRWEPLTYTCRMGLHIREGENACIAFERAPGSDDDLGEPLEIASKASEGASNARSDRRRSRWAS